MKVKPLDRQSLLDIAIQTSGSVEAAFELAAKNDIAISEELARDAELETVAVADKIVLSRYAARNLRPATELSPEDLEAVPYGGIGFMGIEIDFVVS